MCRRKEWHMIRAEWRLGIKQTQAYHNLDWHTTDNIAMSVKWTSLTCWPAHSAIQPLTGGTTGK